MKRIIYILFLSAISSQAIAQNEGRFGIFGGVNQTTLSNAKDAAYGDYLPTFKPTIGVDAGYFFTLFKAIPIGFSVQLSNNKLGQNYHGEYEDSTSFYAYTRLNYLRPGIALHLGSNRRRLVALTFSAGATMGFLTNYQERFELIRYNKDRYIFDIKNTEANLYDTVNTRGTLSAPMYNKTDMTVFGTLGFDVLLSKKIVFGINGRFDMGMSPVENRNAMTINYDNASAPTPFKPYNLVVKYRGPVDLTAQRDETTNLFYGVYISFKYRIFNEEKIEFSYKEHNWEK
jgi:hypothetical protein